MKKSRRRRQHPAPSNPFQLTQDEEERRQELKAISQSHMQLIWEAYQLGDALEGEDARMAEAMAEHTEYHDLWGRLSTVSEETLTEDGTNPMLHVTMHTTVENQLAANNPPEVQEALKRLLKQGVARHEAIHRIAYVLSTEMFYIMRDRRPFNPKRYTRELKKLGR